MILDDWRYRAYHVVTLAGIPLLQLAVYPSLFVTPGGNQSIDPWVYVGFSLSLPAHLQDLRQRSGLDQRDGGRFRSDVLHKAAPGLRRGCCRR